MNSEAQFKIVRGKANYGGNGTVKNLKEVLSLSTETASCIELRVLHCPQLSSINGIEICKQLKSLNISCNAIQDLSALRGLSLLQSLDVKANRIRCLRGIEDLRKLVKVDASQNRIESLEGLGESNCQIQSLILYKNNIRDLNQLKRLEKFRQLKEICFERGSSDRSNPFCLNKQQYYAAVQSYLLASKPSLKKVDDLTPQQLASLFDDKQNNRQVPSQSNISHHQHPNPQRFNQSSQFQGMRSQPVFAQTPSVPLASQKLLLMTQRQVDLQRIIGLKEQSLQELRHRYAQLQLSTTNNFRDALKKQAQLQRVSGQVAELARTIDQKDKKIAELHHRIQELLKASASNNALADKRSQQLQAVRRELGDAKIESASLRAVNKDQQNRLRQLQGKALSNIQQKSARLEQARGRNEAVMRENYQLRRQHQEYKDRLRQLTQLLKEWEHKYEQQLQQLATNHNSEKQQLIFQFDQSRKEQKVKRDEAERIMHNQWQQKMAALQTQYSNALKQTFEKYRRLKLAYDEKSSTEGELKTLLKSVMGKNTESQATIRQYEEAVIKTKKAIISLSAQHDALAKEHHQMRTKLQGQARVLQSQLSKCQFSREKLQREVRQLRATNDYLQKSLDGLTSHEKDYEQLIGKCEDLQTALQAKNVMLDDKVQTIQTLKMQLQAATAQQEGKVDVAQLQKLKEKYRRQKKIVDDLSTQNSELKQANTQLQERCDVNNDLVQEFAEVREIVRKQQMEIREKDQLNAQLVDSLKKLKQYSQNLTDEAASLRNQKNRLLNSVQQKENKWNRTIRERELQHERRMSAVQEESAKFRQIAQQFKSLTKTFNF